MGDVPALLLALHRLNVSPVDAAKRALGGSHGARINSAQHSVSQVLISRLLPTSSEAQIAAVVTSRFGEALLTELRAVTRVACLGLGANASLAPSHIAQVFRATGSNLMQTGTYGSIGLGLAAVLPHAMALRVYRQLVETMVAVQATPIGAALGACLLVQGTDDVEAASTIVQFIGAVRPTLFRRLGIDGGGGGGGAGPSSSAAEEQSLPTTTAYEIPNTPNVLAQLNPSGSLQWNIAYMFEAVLARSLSLAEHVAMQSAMDGALSVLVHGDSGSRSALLARPLLVATSTRGVLVLLASVQDALAEAYAPLPTMPDWFDSVLQSVTSHATAYASTNVGGVDLDELGLPSAEALLAADAAVGADAADVAPAP